MDTGGSIPGVKQLGREVNHSLPSHAEVKNKHSYTSTPSIWLHGMDKEHFIASFYDEKYIQNVKAILLCLNVYM
jgi:hypothetical protein